ncbi:MerR family transcriptional regulator [Candidatus Saccharibacteria bacterium]|nr:MerR family transcriptional regulator [Candidatus Saccharibacteria bacterium]
MGDLLTIKEFSKMSGVESSTLRYWDEIDLYSPSQRDKYNNYRFYTPDQVITVNFIKVMSSLGVPIKTIRELVKSRSPDKIIQLISKQEKLLDQQMSRLRESYSIIHTRRDLIELGNHATNHDDIAVVEEEAMSYALGPRNEFTPGESFYTPFATFCNKAKDFHINLSFPVAGIHDDWGTFMQATGEPSHFISLDPFGNQTREAGRFLVGFHKDYYGQLGDLPERMAKYAKENSLQIIGPVFVRYLHDEICIQDPKQYLSQVCVSVKK